MSLQSHLAFGLIALQCCLVRPLVAETFAERHARDLATSPSDLFFRLDTPNAERRFHMGQRIPISLEFSSSSPEKYKLNGATYDRSGRLPTEQFVLERDDVTDPFQDYFGTGVLGGLAGGLRGYPVLESKPYSINLELNDWFRFDRPGHYRMYLKSHRLTRERAPGEAGETSVQFAAVSNIFEIEILPQNPVWEAAKLAEIRTILGQPKSELPKPGGPPVPHNPLDEMIVLAHRELRFLGTSAAVQLMFDRARDDAGELDTLALLGARDRAQVVAKFDRHLADPEVGFREWDIQVRALFTFIEKEAPKPLLMFPWQNPDPADWEKLRQTANDRQKRFQAFVHAQAVRLIPQVARKTAAARKTSAEAIAEVAPAEAKAAGLVAPDDYGLTREQLIAQFAQFPSEQQLELLTNKWDLVRGAEMIPALRATIEKAAPKPLPTNAMTLRMWGGDGGITQVALRRLNEMSPDDAAAIVHKDLVGSNMRFAGFAMRSLPARELPEADGAFSVLLKENASGALPLLAKFGTARLKEQMHALYESRSWPCAEEESFVTFFIRVQPKDLGADVLRRTMAEREHRGCYTMLLGEVAHLVWNPILEAQAIITLGDSEPEVAMSAARVLSGHGSPDVEPLLWKRLEQWSEKWKGRTEDFRTHPITGAAPNRSEEQLGLALFQSIGAAASWPIDEARRNRLLALCVDDWCKKTWSSDLFTGPVSLDISNGGEMYPTAFRVQGYTARTFSELKTKLEQFPSGTTFRWCPQASNPFDAFTPGQRKEMFEDLSIFLSKHSMIVEPYSTEKCPQ